MNRKTFLLILFSALLCMSVVRTASGQEFIRGWFGKYLELNQAEISPPLRQIETNKNVSIDLTFWNYRDLHVKNIQVEVDCGLNDILNVTLVEDFDWLGGTGGRPGIPFEKNVVFTPSPAGIGSLSIGISADYTYADGNQTFEQTCSINLVGIILVPNVSFNDFQNQYLALQKASGELNASYQNLNGSYQDLQKLTLFLAVAAALLTVTTAIAVSRSVRLEKRIQRSQPTTSS